MGWWGGRGRTGALGLIMVLGPGRGRRDDGGGRRAGLRRRLYERGRDGGLGPRRAAGPRWAV